MLEKIPDFLKKIYKKYSMLWCIVLHIDFNFVC